MWKEKRLCSTCARRSAGKHGTMVGEFDLIHCRIGESVASTKRVCRRCIAHSSGQVRTVGSFQRDRGVHVVGRGETRVQA